MSEASKPNIMLMQHLELSRCDVVTGDWNCVEIPYWDGSELHVRANKVDDDVSIYLWSVYCGCYQLFNIFCVRHNHYVYYSKHKIIFIT